MQETWLKPNRRAIGFACAAPLMLGVIGLWLVVQPPSPQFSPFFRWMGGSLLGAAGVLVALLMRQLVRPRIAYRDGHVLFHLRSGPPLAVPAQFVEAFFLGQGAAELPGLIGRREETVNLVARLSQKQTDWAHRVVKPALGNWCDGYVTIRGTWCEPLGSEVIRRLNRRLKEVKIESGTPSR